jgi:hypothetical protein
MGLEPVTMGRSCGARSGKRETAITGAAEGLLPIHTAITEAECPGARAAGLNDQVQTGASGVRILGAHRSWPNRLNESVGDDFSHRCVLPRGVKG